MDGALPCAEESAGEGLPYDQTLGRLGNLYLLKLDSEYIIAQQTAAGPIRVLRTAPSPSLRQAIIYS